MGSGGIEKVGLTITKMCLQITHLNDVKHHFHELAMKRSFHVDHMLRIMVKMQKFMEKSCSLNSNPLTLAQEGVGKSPHSLLTKKRDLYDKGFAQEALYNINK